MPVRWVRASLATAISAALLVVAMPTGAVQAAPTDSWQSLSPMGQARYGEVAGTLSGGDIIAAGGVAWPAGGNPQTLGSAEIYDPDSNQWSPTTNMPDPTASAGSAVGTDGLFYVFGGYGPDATTLTPSATLQIYNPSNQSWTVGPPMPVARGYVAGAALPDGLVMAIGGVDADANTSSAVEAFDPATSTWSALAPLPNPCQSVGAATGPNGDVYVVGGSCAGDGWSSQLLIYNPSTNSWASGPSLPISEASAAVSFGSDGILYAVGGYESVELSTGFAYDPTLATWSSIPSLPFAEYQQALVPDGSGIVVLGGCGGTAMTANCPSDQALLFQFSAAGSYAPAFISAPDEMTSTGSPFTYTVTAANLH